MITDPRAIRIANEQIRTLADQLAQLYFRALAIGKQASAEDWPKLFPDDTGDIVADKADEDGRPVISGHDVNEILSIASAFVSDLESGKTQSVLKVAVNPQR